MRLVHVYPIQGGCANNYTYVFGDPINSADLSGTKAPSCNGYHRHGGHASVSISAIGSQVVGGAVWNQYEIYFNPDSG
jgi:hypothetical protein